MNAENNSPLIHVGFVIHVMQVAGAEVLTKQIIETLQGKIQATIFCLDAIGQLGEELQAAGVPVVVLGRESGIDRKLPGRLAKEIRDRKIDILHAHQYTPYFYSAMARLVGAWKTKIIFTEHGRHYPDIVSWKRRLGNKWFLSRLCSIATACCRFSAKALETKDGFANVLTIPNGVDSSKLPARATEADRSKLRSKLGLLGDLSYVACIARFHPVKDHSTLIRGWSIVAESFSNAKLLLVGDGPERNAIERLVDELGVRESVEFWGIRSDVGRILQAVDVFTLTSVSEASSLTLLEAMASECPVVVTDVGGNGEHVTEGVEGYLVDRGDHRALAERLMQLIDNEPLRIDMGKKARQRVLDQFELRTTIAAFDKLYQQCISQK